MEEKDEALVLSTAKSEESIKKSETVDTDASTSNEIMIETINHLSNVQMLSEQTPRKDFRSFSNLLLHFRSTCTGYGPNAPSSVGSAACKPFSS